MKTILLVEDNGALRLALRRLLISAGYRVLSAGDCETAVERATETRPDAAILDYVLPPDDDGAPCDGVILLGKLRAICPGLPVALVSGMLPPDPRIQAAGFDEVRPKPMGHDEILLLAERLTR